jgi:hypothetical protein
MKFTEDIWHMQTMPRIRDAVYPNDSSTVRKMQNLADDSPMSLRNLILIQPSKQPAMIMLKTNHNTHNIPWQTRYHRIVLEFVGLLQAPE